MQERARNPHGRIVALECLRASEVTVKFSFKIPPSFLKSQHAAHIEIYCWPKYAL